MAESVPPPPLGRFVVVTGTDTGVGKTVFAGLLVCSLRKAGVNAVGLKPLCSGGREDAFALRDAADGELDVDEVNPWWFAAALAPFMAARLSGQSVRLAQVVAHIRRVARRYEMTVVEGAGGLLSPLGEGFDTRELIRALRAMPVVVCPNRLGAINQSLLAWETLPRTAQQRARLVLVEPPVPDGSQMSNVAFLHERLGTDQVLVLPRFREGELRDPRLAVRRLGTRLLSGLGVIGCG